MIKIATQAENLTYLKLRSNARPDCVGFQWIKLHWDSLPCELSLYQGSILLISDPGMVQRARRYCLLGKKCQCVVPRSFLLWEYVFPILLLQWHLYSDRQYQGTISTRTKNKKGLNSVVVLELTTHGSATAHGLGNNPLLRFLQKSKRKTYLCSIDPGSVFLLPDLLTLIR